MLVFLFITECQEGLFGMCNSIGSYDTYSFVNKEKFLQSITVLHILAVLKFHLFLNQYLKMLYCLLRQMYSTVVKSQMVRINYLDNLF